MTYHDEFSIALNERKICEVFFNLLVLWVNSALFVLSCHIILRTSPRLGVIFDTISVKARRER